MEPGGIRMSEARFFHTQAERCFRLANGLAGPRLADELEALGRAFEREAREQELFVGRRYTGWRLLSAGAP
jgi:hypothetical protein